MDTLDTKSEASSRTDSPGVRVPPPIWYALAVLGGYFLNRQWPLLISAKLFVRLLGLIIGGGGMVLALAGVQGFRHAKTSRVPVRPATALVTSGPYALTRNPMYVGLALATIGCGLLMATWWPILLLVPALAIVQVFVIVPEERYLHRRFGADYQRYVHHVRRWV